MLTAVFGNRDINTSDPRIVADKLSESEPGYKEQDGRETGYLTIGGI